MTKVVLSLGSNLGNRELNLQKALKMLQQYCCNIVKTSRIYQTEPWGFSSRMFFLNQVVIAETDFDPFVLLNKTQLIERLLGRREKTVKSYKPRLIDIDIIFYDNLIIKTPTLSIPHPLMHKRKFVLQPLNEIAPDFVHPLLDMTIAQLYENCQDKSFVEIYEPAGVRR